MKITLKELLEAKGRTSHWLSVTTGISRKDIYKLAKGEAKRISFSNLEKICNALECEISDILKIER